MAKGPDVIIIARHGARLDAADKQWHLGSPTPYDPPLTYGGWSQGKALGVRIAALLHARAEEKAGGQSGVDADLADLEFSALDKGTIGAARGRKRRKHKVVIHSSPYLRCVQTSTAVAAGISQFQPAGDTNGVGATAPKLNTPQLATERNGLLGKSVLAKSPHAVEPAADPSLEVFVKPQTGPEKIPLRVDAFLGEWLSPDYFEDITPPPNSTMMVAGAKADLLRKGDYIEVQPIAPSNKGHFPGGWRRNAASAGTSRKNTEESISPTLTSLAQALPFRERSSSHSGGFRRRSRSRETATSPIATAHKVPSYIYDPPIPSYAVSPADPIPRGYVSHARDACVDIDFQWDSMREPQEWGDGGEYGDEWSTMHKRFRKGLVGMMGWYQEHGSKLPKEHFPGFTYSERPTAKHSATDSLPVSDQNDDDDDEDEELVLVLVTHGAGCNALLGAISSQPVLIDIGLASLSMAVRREVPRRPSTSVSQRPPSIIDPGMSSTYEMKLLASIDHLRPGVDPSKSPKPQSPAVLSSPSLEYRRQFQRTPGANSPVGSPLALGEPLRNRWNSSLGSIRRSNSMSVTGSRVLSGAVGGVVGGGGGGLWSSPRAPTLDVTVGGQRGLGEDITIASQNSQPTSPTATSDSMSSTTTNKSASTGTGTGATTPTTDGSVDAKPAMTGLGMNGCCIEEKEKHDNVAPLRAKGNIGRSVSGSGGGGGGLWQAPKSQSGGNGLWGPPRLDEVYEHGRGPKRRWTVNEEA